MRPLLRAATAGYLAGILGGEAVAIVAPPASRAAFHGLAAGLVVAALWARFLDRHLPAEMPASRAVRAACALGFQVAALALLLVGLRAVDAWHHVPPAARPDIPVVLVSLAALGYTGVRCSRLAAYLRPPPPAPPLPPAAPAA